MLPDFGRLGLGRSRVAEGQDEGGKARVDGPEGGRIKGQLAPRVGLSAHGHDVVAFLSLDGLVATGDRGFDQLTEDDRLAPDECVHRVCVDTRLPAISATVALRYPVSRMRERAAARIRPRVAADPARRWVRS